MFYEQNWSWSSNESNIGFLERKYRKSLLLPHQNVVKGSFVAFQGASPNSRAAHPGQESPGVEGKDYVIISILLITTGIPALRLTNLGQTVTLLFGPRGEPSAVSLCWGTSF